MINNIQLAQLETLLKSKNADYTISVDSSTVGTAAQGAQQYGISLQETTPTLILKSKEKYYAAIICGNTRISFKKLKQALGVKDITLADPETVRTLTGANVGEVSLVNTELPTVVDSHVLKNEYCYGGCGIPRATLKINTSDLIRITDAKILDFTEPRS